MHLYCSIDGQINTYLKNILKKKTYVSLFVIIIVSINIKYRLELIV